MHTSNLHAKVAARNSANAQARQFAPSFLAALAPFVGTKIKLATGEFSAKFKAAMPSAGEYWNRSDYSLSRVFKTCENGARGCYYAEATVYFGTIDGGVLTELSPFNPDDFRVNYNAEEIAAARLDVRAKREALQRAESALCLFGEHDNG